MKILLIALLSMALATTTFAAKERGFPFKLNSTPLKSVLNKSETVPFVGLEYGKLVENYEGLGLRSSVELDHIFKELKLGATTTFIEKHQVEYYASYLTSTVESTRVNGIETSLAGNGLSSKLSGIGVGIGYKFIFNATPEVRVGLGPSVERLQIKEVFCSSDATASLGTCSTSRHTLFITDLQVSVLAYKYLTPYIKILKTSRVGKNPNIPTGQGLGLAIGVKGNIDIFN